MLEEFQKSTLIFVISSGGSGSSAGVPFTLTRLPFQLRKVNLHDLRKIQNHIELLNYL